jgi:hypothetical protein
MIRKLLVCCQPPSVANFPLAPLFCLINNVLEVRVDACKLCYFYRKPEAMQSSGIGESIHTRLLLSYGILGAF